MNRKQRVPVGDAVDRLVMIGAAVPQDVMDALMKADREPQVQTHKLSWAVIHGIEFTGLVVDLISTVAISDYPQADWLCSGYRKWDRANGSDNRLAPFINVLGLKQITRFLSCFVLLIRWAIAHRGEECHVLLYGLINAHLYAVWCVKRIFGFKGTVLITDLPGQATASRHEPWLKSILRPLDRKIIYTAVQAADGVIALTKKIADDFAFNIPSIVMEGVVSVDSETLVKNEIAEQNRASADFSVMYAGGLQSNYGIPLLLETFKYLRNENFSLWLLGRGDMEKFIIRRSEEDSRIKFLGLVEPNVAFQRSLMATVLINPRPSQESFTPYSFPSKLLEYMATGRPVIATRLSGIPSEYDPYLIWLDDETPEGLSTLLRDLRKRPSDELDAIGKKAQLFVLQEKNFRRQGRRIVDFIEKINTFKI